MPNGEPQNQLFKDHNQFTTLDAHPKTHINDYNKEIPLTQKITAGVCEIKGRRGKQEDQLCLALKQVELFSKLTDAEIKAAIDNTTKEIAQQCYSKEEGSTACMATAWIDEKNTLHSVVANLGDSTAFMVVLDEKGDVSKQHPPELLHALHNAANESEVKRVKDNKGFIIQGRLNYALSVLRALGDNSHDGHGISHDFETTIAGPKQMPNEQCQAYMVVACDGLTEADCLDKNSIAKIIQENRRLTPGVIAAKLVSKAYETSGDNISVAVIPVPRGNIPVSAVVFDGHGGPGIAEKASILFYDLLEKRLKNAAELTPVQPTTTSFKTERTPYAITPEMAGYLYKLVDARGHKDEIAGLDNVLAPNKFKKTLELLFPDFRSEIGFNVPDGYLVTMTPGEKFQFDLTIMGQKKLHYARSFLQPPPSLLLNEKVDPIELKGVSSSIGATALTLLTGRYSKEAASRPQTIPYLELKPEGFTLYFRDPEMDYAQNLTKALHLEKNFSSVEFINIKTNPIEKPFGQFTSAMKIQNPQEIRLFIETICHLSPGYTHDLYKINKMVMPEQSHPTHKKQ